MDKLNTQQHAQTRVHFPEGQTQAERTNSVRIEKGEFPLEAAGTCEARDEKRRAFRCRFWMSPSQDWVLFVKIDRTLHLPLRSVQPCVCVVFVNKTVSSGDCSAAPGSPRPVQNRLQGFTAWNTAALQNRWAEHAAATTVPADRGPRSVQAHSRSSHCPPATPPPSTALARRGSWPPCSPRLVGGVRREEQRTQTRGWCLAFSTCVVRNHGETPNTRKDSRILGQFPESKQLLPRLHGPLFWCRHDANDFGPGADMRSNREDVLGDT